MQATSNAGVTPAIAGIDQQDFQQIQLLQGMYPYQKGLQMRIPGKTLQSQQNTPVGGIEVFYNVYGRPYILSQFDGAIQIDPVTFQPITLPALPPWGNIWFDDFSGYSPDGLISNIWGAGVWDISPGICQTIIEGYFDPYAIFATIHAGGIGNIPSQQPKTVSIPSTPASSLGPNDPKFQYPLNPPQVFLNIVTAEGDNSCEGQGTSPITATDFINFYNYETGPIVDTLLASGVTVGHITVFHGLRIGRMPDVDAGLVQGACPGPPPPTPKGYSLFGNDGSFGQTS